jgi:hypothetical protein
MAVKVFGLAVSVVGITGCGLGRSSDPSPATEASATGIGSTSLGSSATPAGVAPTVPITAAAPVPATAEPSGLDTIEAANQNLWDAWRDDDRPRALAYATGAAVDALFLSKWGPEVRNQGCGIASGIPRCVYTLRGGARVVIMGQNAAGFFAQRVETIGALPSSNRLESEIVDDTVVFDETNDASATDPALPSDTTGSDVLSQNGLESPLTPPMTDPSEEATDLTVRASPWVPMPRTPENPKRNVQFAKRRRHRRKQQKQKRNHDEKLRRPFLLANHHRLPLPHQNHPRLRVRFRRGAPSRRWHRSGKAPKPWSR